MHILVFYYILQLRGDYMTDFKIILSSLMDEYGMDQKTLASRTGLTQATISRYTLGKAIPTGENLGLMADVFDVSVDYLLGRTDVRAVNKRKKEDITTLAAHKANEGPVKNVEELEALISKILEEKLSK